MKTIKISFVIFLYMICYYREKIRYSILIGFRNIFLAICSLFLNTTHLAVMKIKTAYWCNKYRLRRDIFKGGLGIFSFISFFYFFVSEYYIIYHLLDINDGAIFFIDCWLSGLSVCVLEYLYYVRNDIFLFYYEILSRMKVRRIWKYSFFSVISLFPIILILFILFLKNV